MRGAEMHLVIAATAPAHCFYEKPKAGRDISHSASSRFPGGGRPPSSDAHRHRVFTESRIATPNAATCSEARRPSSCISTSRLAKSRPISKTFRKREGEFPSSAAQQPCNAILEALSRLTMSTGGIDAAQAVARGTYAGISPFFCFAAKCGLWGPFSKFESIQFSRWDRMAKPVRAHRQRHHMDVKDGGRDPNQSRIAPPRCRTAAIQHAQDKVRGRIKRAAAGPVLTTIISRVPRRWRGCQVEAAPTMPTRRWRKCAPSCPRW